MKLESCEMARITKQTNSSNPYITNWVTMQTIQIEIPPVILYATPFQTNRNQISFKGFSIGIKTTGISYMECRTAS